MDPNPQEMLPAFLSCPHYIDLSPCVISSLSCWGLTTPLPPGPMWASLEKTWPDLAENAVGPAPGQTLAHRMSRKEGAQT